MGWNPVILILTLFVINRKRATVTDTMISNDLVMLWKPLLQELDKEFPTFALELVSALTERIDAGNSFTLDSMSSYTVSYRSRVFSGTYLLLCRFWIKNKKKSSNRATLQHSVSSCISLDPCNCTDFAVSFMTL